VLEKTSKGAPISDIYKMEMWLNSPEFCFINYSNTVHLVIMPAHPRFEMYDVLEAHKDNGQWKLIAGYQAKTLKEIKKKDVKPAVLPDSSSWLVYLHESATTDKPREDGWIKLNQTQLSKFLGVSLWDCAEKLIAGSISCNYFVLETSSNSFWLYNYFSLHKSSTHKCIVLFAT